MDAFSLTAKNFLEVLFEKLPKSDLPSIAIIRNFLSAWKLQFDDNNAPFHEDCKKIDTEATTVVSFIQLVEAHCSLSVQQTLNDSSSAEDINAMISVTFPLLGKDLMSKLGGFNSIKDITGSGLIISFPIFFNFMFLIFLLGNVVTGVKSINLLFTTLLNVKEGWASELTLAMDKRPSAKKAVFLVGAPIEGIIRPL
jgi:hypothetical protein